VKKWQKNYFLLLLAAICIILTACVSASNDVPSLAATPTKVVEDRVSDGEAALLAFTECMREQGVELIDPVVDSKGDVQPPEVAEGVELTREQWNLAFEVCGALIEGITFGREREDVTDKVDQFVVIATCLRDKGYDVDDPTAETFDQWAGDFRTEFDWDDPDAVAAYETCSADGDKKDGKDK